MPEASPAAGKLTTAAPAAGHPAARALTRTGPWRLRGWPALGCAVAGGLVLAAAFPPAGIWPFAIAGPALLVLAIWGQRLRGAFGLGLVFGLAFFFPLLSWLVNVAWYAWAALAIALSVVFAALTVGQRLLLRLRWWTVAVAAWWVAAEAVRTRWPYGFPWGRLAMSQAEAPTVGWVAVGGPVLLTFLLALAGACLAWLVLGSGIAREMPGSKSGWRGIALDRLIPLLALLAAVGVALAGSLLPADPGRSGNPTAVVAAIQGDVPHARNLPTLWRATRVTQNHATATEALAARVRAGRAAAPNLVIWPENSTDQDPRLDPYIYATIMTAVNKIDRPVLVGAVLENPRRNAGQLWLPHKGPVAIYVKRQLVPFGEYIPFRSLLLHFTSLPNLQPVNFTPGHKAVVFPIGKIRLGEVICYEVGFDNLVASEVNAGANLLAMQTNDADFELDGQTGETWQQLDMARIRAVEYDRAVVVASTTGVSAVVAPDGRLLTSTTTWHRAEIEARVPLRDYVTVAQRLGDWPERVLSVVAALAFAWAVLGAYRDRRRAAKPVRQAQ